LREHLLQQSIHVFPGLRMLRKTANGHHRIGFSNATVFSDFANCVAKWFRYSGWLASSNVRAITQRPFPPRFVATHAGRCL